MQPIQINVSVNIGVTPELNGLLTSLFNRPQVEAPAAAPAQKKPRAARQQPVVENPEQQQETAPVAEPEQTPEPKTEAAAPVEAEPAAAHSQEKNYTEVDVREAMDRTRKRIEGENYKEQTDSEGYKKWHRRLTAFFKNTAALFGAEKPSTLPDSESRYKFIACCDAVYVKDDELVEDCPF